MDDRRVLSSQPRVDPTPDTFYMRQALEVATRKGDKPWMSPFGCVIVKNGAVLAARHNLVLEKCDATAHAEVEAIRAAGANLSRGDLRGATLYTTLQPCGMCTMAAIWSKIGRIVYGAGREDVHRMYFECRANPLDFVAQAYRTDIEVQGGILREECAVLYYRPWDEVGVAEQANL